MVRQVCLDSDVLIELLRQNEKTKQTVESLNAEFFTTAINSFELWFGRKKSELVFEFLEILHLLPLDDKSARIAADLRRELERRGEPIDLRDLFIAAICITNSIELFTYNKKHFERLKEFGLILV